MRKVFLFCCFFCFFVFINSWLTRTNIDALNPSRQWESKRKSKLAADVCWESDYPNAFSLHIIDNKHSTILVYTKIAHTHSHPIRNTKKRSMYTVCLQAEWGIICSTYLVFGTNIYGIDKDILIHAKMRLRALAQFICWWWRSFLHWNMKQ